LADMSISVLTPALLFAKITKSLDRETLISLWFVPVSYVALGFAGLEWTRLASKAARLPDGFRRLCAVAVFFSNVNTVMIPIMQSISASPGARFLLRDESDTPEALADRCIAYGMVIGIMNNMLRWSLGVALMNPPSLAHHEAVVGTEEQPLLAASTEARSAEPRNERFKRMSSGIHAAIAPYVTPPLCSIALAILVVLVPPLQQALMRKGTYAFAVWSAIDACGDACIPLTLFSLGGQLRLDDGKCEVSVSAEKQAKGVAIVLLGRFVIVPAFTCAALLGVYKYASWMIPLLRGDPGLFLTLAIVSATPPAINLLTVAQNMGVYEDEAAKILSYAYAV
ncbi:hypothetical protein GQ54DRAFT_240301, partial [Martensiomyces pterosporus]